MSAPVRTAVFFGLAAAFACLAFGRGLERLTDASFAWHMVQHLILLYILPLLVLLARPFETFVRIAEKGTVALVVRKTRFLHVLVSPPVALGVFIGTLWGTHFSGVYELALDVPAVHILEHAAYVAAGLAFWTPVVAPAPLRPNAYPVRLLYLLVALPQGALLSVALDGARVPLYAHYAAVHSTAAAMVDQQNAAAVMWIGGGAIAFAALIATMAKWALLEGRGDAGAPVTAS